MFEDVDKDRFFICSYCGFQVKDWQAYYTTIENTDGNTEHNDIYYNFQFRYCPKCGHQCEEIIDNPLAVVSEDV